MMLLPIISLVSENIWIIRDLKLDSIPSNLFLCGHLEEEIRATMVDSIEDLKTEFDGNANESNFCFKNVRRSQNYV